MPLRKSDIEPRQDGKPLGYGLRLYVLDTDHWKSAVHERLRYPEDAPAAWTIDADADDRYLRQLVSEARVVKPSGDFEWVLRSRDNHFLDCEAMALAAGYLLGVQRLTETETRVRATKPAQRATGTKPAPSEPRAETSDSEARAPLALRHGGKSAPASAPQGETAFDRARRISQQLNRR